MKQKRKGRFVRTYIIFALLFVSMMFIFGCGKEAIAANSSPTASAAPTAVPEATPTDVPKAKPTATPTMTPTQLPKEEPEVSQEITANETEESEFTAVELAKDKAELNFGGFAQRDQVSTYVELVEYNPYYIGRTNYEENIDYIKKNKAAEDKVLYLGLPMYLPDQMESNVVYVEVDDPSVAKIEDAELIGLKQGTFCLFMYDSEKNLIGSERYVCTTFNDSVENKESYMTIQNNASLINFVDAWDIDYWKASVHTIMDMSLMLQARHFKYDFSGEPMFGEVSCDVLERGWTWTASAETIFDMSRGVCVQVAQLALYMLAGDYEDWGVVLIDGNQGHIFNWFYEDGYYYIFDFTEVISDNAWGRDESTQYYDYWDYSDRVIKCKTIEDIKKYCTTQKVDLEQNYAIYMYSCKGHDFIPCNINTGMSNSNAALYGEWESITIAFQDVVLEDLVVLYENPKSAKIIWRAFTQEEMSKAIPIGVYSRKEKYIYRHKY